MLITEETHIPKSLSHNYTGFQSIDMHTVQTVYQIPKLLINLTVIKGNVIIFYH